jgi:hypothetical protein
MGIVEALETMGPALVHGGISTFLAISALALSDIYVFDVFFRMFLLIVSFGMFHGMVFVPTALSLVGPEGYFASVREKEEKLACFNDSYGGKTPSPVNTLTSPSPCVGHATPEVKEAGVAARLSS